MERETMPVDVLFVGGGPACLAGAIRLMDLIQAHNEEVAAGGPGQALEEPMIAVIEKGSEIGSHGVSGAVLDPRALDELLPDWRTRQDFPLERWVEKESFVVLTPTAGFPAPIVPPDFQDHGKPIVSIARFQKWLAAIAEERGVSVFPGFAGWELLYDEQGQVRGVRTGDKGVDKDGSHKSNFEPGMDLEAKVTVIGEGPRGHLARQLIERFQLDAESQPQAYELGCKEVLEFPPGTVKEGEVTLTLGYPLGLSAFGGAFIYTMAGDKMCIGLLAALDAADPALDVHYLLQKLKNHPYIRRKLRGGKVVKYGAKSVTVGGWASMPKVYAPGAMICGDSASFLNAARIKGIHLSMKSGMLAAETAFDALVAGDASEQVLSGYKRRIDESWVRAEMEPVRNFHGEFANKGLIGGSFAYGMTMLFGPKSTTVGFHPDHEGMQKLVHVHRTNQMPGRDDLTYDGEYLVDKLTDVYLSGTKHDEHQPCHLRVSDTEICATRCVEEYGNPCERFCPAQVYNMRPNEKTGRKELEVDFSNCVHCKTCDIRDPYQIIKWVPPEGGDGPEYHSL